MADLASQLGYPATPVTMRNRLSTILKRDDHLVLVALTGDGVVCGWIQAHVGDYLESGRRTDIVGLIVGQPMRRTGIGRLLVTQVERWATAQRCEVVGVRSNVNRTESHHFYPALGFKNIKMQVAYRKQLDPGTEDNRRRNS